MQSKCLRTLARAQVAAKRDTASTAATRTCGLLCCSCASRNCKCGVILGTTHVAASTRQRQSWQGPSSVQAFVPTSSKKHNKIMNPQAGAVANLGEGPRALGMRPITPPCGSAFAVAKALLFGSATGGSSASAKARPGSCQDTAPQQGMVQMSFLLSTTPSLL